MRITEEFLSWQGTGLLAGQQMYFVRTAGCSVACPIRKVCDEAGSLDPQSGRLAGIDGIVGRACASGAEWISITGGEPMEQDDLGDLISLARTEGLKVNLQTSGLIKVPYWVDLLTVSPKSTKLEQAVGKEMTLVAAPWVTLDRAEELLYSTNFDHYYIVPLDDQQSCIRWCLRYQAALDIATKIPEYRLGFQLHKYYGVL